MTSNWNSELNPNLVHNWYKKGQYIYFEGSQMFGLFFICSGKVKVTTRGLAGKEQIIRLASTGHILGNLQVKNPGTYTSSAITLEDSLICFANNEVLHEAFQSNSELILNMMLYYSGEINHYENRSKYLSRVCLNEKVAEALLYIIEVFGLNNQQELNVKITRKEIGDLVGASSEQISRVLTLFKERKIVETKRRKITISNYNKLMHVGKGKSDG